jgi:hypothetical protein
VGFHQGQQGGETIEVVMAVMEVVDEADVGPGELLKDSDLVLGLAEPATVIVEPDRAADPRGFVGDGPERPDGRYDLLGLTLRPGCRIRHCDPELGADHVPLQQVEDRAGVRVERGGEPEPDELDPMPLQGLHLGVEAGDVLGTPVA